MRWVPWWCAGYLLVSSLLVSAWGEGLVWAVQRPVTDNALSQVGVEGVAKSGHRWGAATLLLGCRGDTPPALLSVRLPADGLGFKLKPFEGLNGAGERSGLARLYLGRERGLVLAVSGRREAAHFVLESKLPVSLSKQLLNSGRLKLVLKAPQWHRGELEMHFTLPDDELPLKLALTGCGV